MEMREGKIHKKFLLANNKIVLFLHNIVIILEKSFKKIYAKNWNE